MDINLLVIVVIGVVFVIGVILALQTAAGRKGLSSVALRLAEALIDYAVRWLSHALPEQSIAGVGPVSNDLDRATAALRELRHA